MRFPSATGLLFILLGACDGHSAKNMGALGGDNQKIIVRRDQVYDLSGYAGGGGGNPFCLFDENAVVDPRERVSAEHYIPFTNCQPTIHPSIYFQGTAGSRIVIDLEVPYALHEIYLYDRSHEADSCWIYTGDLKAWKPVAAFTTVSQTGDWGWKKITLSVQSRFVMIRFSSYETAITEMVLYGKPAAPAPAVSVPPVPKGFTKTRLDQFLGVNYIMEAEPRWLRPFHYSRIYNFALDYDADTSRDEKKARFNMLHYGYFNRSKNNYVFDIDTLRNVNQGNVWFSIRGVSGWMSSLGYTDKDRPVNRPSLNPEDPASYSRHARMMWHLAAFFGYEAVDTTLLSLSHEPRRSGRGSMQLFENGNEEDANWVGDKYCPPYAYFAQSTADWDGDEGRLGERHGIFQADPSSRLMMSGLTGLDTNRVKVYRLLSENLRRDKKFIWQGGIQYHYYAHRGDHGISPEEDSMRSKLCAVAECSYRIAPGVKCFLGENGYDKSPVSRQRTPFIPGMSPAESQGVMLLRSINASFFSGFDAYILYWLRDGFPESDPRVYLTSGILRTMPDGKTFVYPGWYYINTLVNRLGKYRPDKILRESGDVWIYKYRHADIPDSVAYFMYSPTVTGKRISDFMFTPDKRCAAHALQIRFADRSEEGLESPIPVVDDKIRITVGENPVLILCKER